MTNNAPSADDPRFDPRSAGPADQDAERADRLSREDRFEDSLAQTWDPGDAAVDRRLRSLIGPVTPLYAPPYGFERVVLRARRRRNRGVLLGLAAGFTAIALAGGAVVVGARTDAVTIQSAGCAGTDSYTGSVSGAAPGAPGAADSRHGSAVSGFGVATGFGSFPAMAAARAVVDTRDGAHGADGAGSGIGSGREVMDRKYEWAIGGVLTAAALTAGIVAGCSSSSSGNEPSATATESSAATPSPSSSVSAVTLPAPTASTTASGAGQGSAKVPQCHTADLSPAVTIVPGSQATGHELMNLKLTNTSGHTCTVYGYPGMMLEDANSSGQATKVTRDRSLTPKTIVVPYNGSVATSVRFDFDIPASDEPQTGPCEAPSVYLLITPPDEETQLSTTISGGPVTVCEHGALNVLPFTPGPKGANQ